VRPGGILPGTTGSAGGLAMVSRREFVTSGIAICASARLNAGILTGPGLGATSLYKVIYDERFPASVAYGHEAMRRGLEVQAIRGDITDFWYYDLYPQWQKAPVGMRVLSREPRPDDLIAWTIAPKRRA